MASELKLKWAETGITAYAIVYNATGQAWNGSAYEDFTDANIANYDVALTEAGTDSQWYIGTMPAGAAALAVSISYHKQAGGSPAVTDQLIGTENYRLNAAAVADIQSGLAQPGDEMDLVDAPNSTAIDAIQDGLATSTEVTSIQNNTRVVRVVPTVIERPDSGTQEYRIELLLYDAVGNMEAPDSAPTIALVDQGGTDLSARLDSATMALVSTGRYRAIYTASDTDDLEQLVWAFSVIEGGLTRVYGNTTIIVDTTAVDFTSADRTVLQAAATQLSLDAAKVVVDAILADTGTDGVVVAAGSKTGYSLSGTLQTLDAIWAKIAAWLGALAGKTADTATRAEIQSTVAGAGYNETTDSLEANRDNIGTAGAGLTAVSGGGGGGATLEEIIAGLSDRDIVILSPVAEDGTITIWQGDGYTESNAIEIPVDDWDGEDPATYSACKFAVMLTSAYNAGTGANELEVDATGILTSTTATFTIELTNTQTNALTPSPALDPYNYTYQLRGVEHGGDKRTILSGAVTVKRRVVS